MKLAHLQTIKEAKDMSELPPDAVSSIKKEIQKGAKDLDLNWANALELVHRAYELSNVERPTPILKSAWKQYEDFIHYAVNQLAKYRGVDGDWRSTSLEP